MVRTQIQLTEAQAEALKRMASERNVSIAQVIREALDAHLAEPRGRDRRARALASIGGFRSGRKDVSERHDDYLTEAFAK